MTETDLDFNVLDDLQKTLAGFDQRAAGRPFVTLTFAQSIDGSIAAVPGSPLALSSPAALRMTHALRAMHSCILVGIGTVIADNPSLTCRLVTGDNPQPVVIDARLRFPLTYKLLAPVGVIDCRRPIIICVPPPPEESVAHQERRAQLQRLGATILECAATADGHVDLGSALGTCLHCHYAAAASSISALSADNWSLQLFFRRDTRP